MVTKLLYIIVLRSCHSGCDLAFQASNTGSIPVLRSNYRGLYE